MAYCTATNATLSSISGVGIDRVVGVESLSSGHKYTKIVTSLNSRLPGKCCEREVIQFRKLRHR
jgi:hypothetical protein